MARMTRLLPLLAALALAPAAHAAVPGVQAHRGGPVLNGTPAFPEESMAAFRNAAEELNAVLELDVKLTKDRVPVVIHDATLDRTTNCEGLVADRTLAELAPCMGDVLGAPGNDLPTAPAPAPTPIPTLEEVLAFAVADGIGVNLEIKNYFTDPDHDPTPAFANRVMDVVLASGIPAEQIILQSFTPDNLQVAEQRMPDADKALLALANFQDAALQGATASGWEWVSPSWPVSKDYVDEAHARGIKVVPYTINQEADVVAAAKAGVDALITDDPLMALKTLDTEAPQAVIRPRTKKLRKVRRSRKLPLRVSLDEAGEVRIGARLGRRSVGDLTLSFGRGGGTQKATLRLTRAAKKALRGRSKAKIRLVARAEDVVRNGGTVKVAAKLR